MDHSKGGVLFSANGLHFALTTSNNYIDQYGRVFENKGLGKVGKFLGCGYATHC